MKVSAPYESLVQGVSQQAPELRGPGRMTEQVNMIPDPVYGVTRRHGTVWQADKNTGAPVSGKVAAFKEVATWRPLSCNNGTVDLDVLYRTRAAVPGAGIDPVVAYDRTNKKYLTYRRNTIDTVLDSWESGGASAMVSVGKYLFSAGNSVIPTATTTDNWGSVGNSSKAAVWVRGGAYSRTFTVTVQHTTLGAVTVSYTTPSASYPGELDTSGIPQFVRAPAGGTTADKELVYIRKDTSPAPWGLSTYAWRCRLVWGQWSPSITAGSLTVNAASPTALTNSYPAAPTASQYYWAPNDRYVYFNQAYFDALYTVDPSLQNVWVTIDYSHDTVDANPNYTAAVTDATAEYNTAVTRWISSSSAAIQPEAIAQTIKLALDAALVTCTLEGAHILFDNVTSVEVSDSGDNTLIRGVSNTISDITEVTAVHYPGKVVRVQPKNSAESFYLKALGSGTAPTKVTWVEGSAVTHSITAALIYLVVDSDYIYAASSASLLNALVAGDHPSWEASAVGDIESQPAPAFVGNTISYLGMFQDRLLIGSKGTVTLSRTGDYLNIFRSTVLTVPSSDPYTMRAEGPDDDVLRYSALYNKDLIIFGRRRQYVIQGRSPLSPTSANMPVMSSHGDAADVPPLEAGGLVFYAGAAGTGSSAVFQIEQAYTVDSLAAFPASSQLDSYIKGNIVDMSSTTRPMALYCKTDAETNELYVMQYVDSNQGRKQDAWYKWTFNAAIGRVVGVTNKNGNLLLHTLREDAGTLWWVADSISTHGGLSALPYLDSLRLYSSVGVPGNTLSTVPTSPWAVAFDNTSSYFLQGRASATQAAALQSAFPAAPSGSRWVGAMFDAYVIPTNPVMKDKSNIPITTGELTIGSMGLVVKNSSGVTYTVSDQNTTESYTLNGRVLGTTVVGRVPITTGKYTIPIFKGSTQYTLVLAANTWLPLTISSIDWVGQFFNRTARMV